MNKKLGITRKTKVKRSGSREQLLADSIRDAGKGKSTKRVPIAIKLLRSHPKVKARPTVSKKLAESGLLGRSMDRVERAFLLHVDKDTGLPKPKSKYGYSEAEVKDILFERFGRWMRGQTMMMEKDGTSIYYTCDVYRYVNGLPVID